MNLKLIVPILVIAAAPVCAQAQKPSVCEGDQGGRAKGPQNYQQRQGQDPTSLRYEQTR